jgi:hypothetical protein
VATCVFPRRVHDGTPLENPMGFRVLRGRNLRGDPRGTKRFKNGYESRSLGSRKSYGFRVPVLEVSGDMFTPALG